SADHHSGRPGRWRPGRNVDRGCGRPRSCLAWAGKAVGMTDRAPAAETRMGMRPPPRRRPRRTAEQSREQILRAATAEFAAHGLAGGRISRIVRNARTNPRMIYEHFGSKSALYVATLEGALGELRADELTLDVEHLDPLEGLLQL